MTGDEIIALARADFGEAAPLTISADTSKEYLNRAQYELFQDLPPERQKANLLEEAVTATTGQGTITNTWDRIVEVYVNDVPAAPVGREVISNADYGTLFAPSIPVFHIDNSHVWVRPVGGTVKVVHLNPPNRITDTTVAVTSFREQWHRAMAFLITSYMYAQEEDTPQAAHYRAEYTQYIAGQLQQSSEESE